MTETQRRIAAEAWAFRTRVEREAADRFTRLATAISRFDAASPLPAMMQRAVEDEQRHAALCASGRQRRRGAIFARTLEEVVMPGLEKFGIDGAPARAWLSARIR